MVTIKVINEQSDEESSILGIDDIVVLPGVPCSDDTDNSNDVGAVAWVGLAVLIVVVVVVFFLCRRRRRRRRLRQNDHTKLKGGSSVPNRMTFSVISAQSHRYTHFPHAHSDTSVRLRIHETIGEGNFGRVFRGEAKDILTKGSWTEVAVKMCKEDATEVERRDLMKETELLSQIPKHMNIVTFLGSTITSGVAMLIVEYVNGPNLLHFLRRHRPPSPDSAPARPPHVGDRPPEDRDVGQGHLPGEDQGQKGHPAAEEKKRPSSDADPGQGGGGEAAPGARCLLAWQELASLGLQVARGMEHLAAFKIVHRDLAARNVLVDENGVCKICDFGLARLLAEDNVYERKSKGALPIRWMSPESLKQGVYTTKSDVFSYGVVVWEIVTLGASPWPGMKAHDVMARVLNQDLLPKPDHCSHDIYSIMTDCWRWGPGERPTFSGIRAVWEAMLERDGDYLQMDHIDYEMYSALEPSSSSSSLSADHDDGADDNDDHRHHQGQGRPDGSLDARPLQLRVELEPADGTSGSRGFGFEPLPTAPGKQQLSPPYP